MPPTRSAGLTNLIPVAVIVAAFALVHPASIALNDPFLIKIGTRVLVFAIAAASLNLVLGYGGLVSLLHSGLFGIGGYAVAILAFHDFSAEPLFGFLPGTSNLAISLPLALIVSGTAAGLLGLVSLRTSGTYFIMITLAFNQMLYYVFVALQQYGGDDGLQILSNLNLAGFDVSKRVPFYYLCLAVLALVLILLQRIVDSRFGMVLRASAQNERRVIALGIPAMRYKLAAFILSGALTGLAGALLAAGQQFISPADMSWVRSGDLVVMCVLGGMAMVWGPVIGAAAFLVFELVLSSWTQNWQLGFGLLVIAIVVFLKGGLVDLAGTLRRQRTAA
ncbi:MAG: branched-chain amino acid transport system permease protein [Methylobacteriaceae bacterium]|nr:branched-chain amino acid transport system permease protein [Methylobacteriaceae bacterium]